LFFLSAIFFFFFSSGSPSPRRKTSPSHPINNEVERGHGAQPFPRFLSPFFHLFNFRVKKKY
jgi:hypothetical protein